jgi:hypothetical protein
VLSAILGAIKTSTGASPATAILGAVTSVIAGGEAARFNVTGLLKNFHVGATNASTVVATIKAAVADAKVRRACTPARQKDFTCPTSLALVPVS